MNVPNSLDAKMAHNVMIDLNPQNETKQLIGFATKKQYSTTYYAQRMSANIYANKLKKFWYIQAKYRSIFTNYVT